MARQVRPVLTANVGGAIKLLLMVSVLTVTLQMCGVGVSLVCFEDACLIGFHAIFSFSPLSLTCLHCLCSVGSRSVFGVNIGVFTGNTPRWQRDNTNT